MAINTALSKIPIKFGGKYMEITPTKELLGLFKKLNEDYEDYKAEVSSNGLPIIRRVEPSYLFYGEYDNCDTCVYNGREFTIEWDDASPEEVHVKILMEYDFIDKKYTKKYWRVDARNQYHPGRPIFAKEAIQCKPIKPMSLPIGKLQYLDFDWALKVNEKSDYHYEPPKIPHEKIEYTRVYDGATVSRIIENENNPHTKINLEKRPELLYPFMDYELTYEAYKDEDTETLTKISLFYENHFTKK